MKALVCQNSLFSLAERDEPAPGEGQVLLKVLRCGICGSDLHARHHCDHLKNLAEKVGFGDDFASQADPCIYGHELSLEVMAYGPGTRRKIKPGTHVVAQPLLRTGGVPYMVGYSKRYNGGFAERMILQESTLVPVTNGLPPAVAALTEPMAVGWHAVRRSEIGKKDVAIVIGCGPVGLAVICLLKAHGVKRIVASDFSAGRRELALACGADVTVNPAESSPYANWEEFGFINDFGAALNMGMDAREKLERLPIPWYHAWRILEKLGAAHPPRPVIFECVGVPGILAQIIEGAPLLTRIVVAGVCMQPDRIEPALGIQKEIDLRFVFGHSPLEFRDTLHMMAEGKVQCAHLVTGEVGLMGIDTAFNALAHADRHAKILVDPASAAVDPG
jgi:threonine dehydrogenase-like Zn-dependent dehydrogenase